MHSFRLNLGVASTSSQYGYSTATSISHDGHSYPLISTGSHEINCICVTKLQIVTHWVEEFRLNISSLFFVSLIVIFFILSALIIDKIKLSSPSRYRMV